MAGFIFTDECCSSFVAVLWAQGKREERRELNPTNLFDVFNLRIWYRRLKRTERRASLGIDLDMSTRLTFRRFAPVGLSINDV